MNVIELPRAALKAKDIAKHADFFGFELTIYFKQLWLGERCIVVNS